MRKLASTLLLTSICIVVIIALLLISLPPYFTPGCLAHESKSLNPEWVHNDLHGVGILLRTIPIGDRNTVEDLRRAIKGKWSLEDETLGFGGRKLRYGKGLGYTSIYVDVLSFNE